MEFPTLTQITPSSAKRPIVQLSTKETYNKWADIYDHDSNILQLLDDTAYTQHLPPLLNSSHPLKILDLGCGTGRNTIKLHRSLPNGSELIAVDFSASMMSKARLRLSQELAPPSQSTQNRNISVKYVLHDIENGFCIPGVGVDGEGKVDGVVSTLVLEHLSLDRFFETVGGVLKHPKGWVWVTSMHPELGAVSKAGFVTKLHEEEVKFQGVSFNHRIEEILEAAERVGLRLEGEVVEKGVEDERHAEVLGRRARKWVGVKMLVGMVFVWA